MSPPIYLKNKSTEGTKFQTFPWIQKPPCSPHLGPIIGQQPKNFLLLGKLIAPAQAIGLTSPAAKPVRGSILYSRSAGSQLPDSTFDTTVNTQLVFGDNLGIFSVDTSTTVGVATRMPNTWNSSSLFAGTSAGPLVVMGPTAPMGRGSYVFSMSTPGLTHSQASKASTVEMDLGRPIVLLLYIALAI